MFKQLRILRPWVWASIMAFILCAPLFAQDIDFDAERFGSYQWRNIGPVRGGRSLSCIGSPGRPNEYYFGATGGGLWKTTDGGNTWFPVTDGKITSSSVGAVAVAETNPDVVYIGGGETQLRGSITQGDGVYKSTDGGKTWRHLGSSRDTGDLAHPRPPDQSRHRLRRRPRTSLRRQRGARRLPLDGRRQHLGEGPLRQRQGGCRRSHHRSHESQRHLRLHLAGLPQRPG